MQGHTVFSNTGIISKSCVILCLVCGTGSKRDDDAFLGGAASYGNGNRCNMTLWLRSLIMYRDFPGAFLLLPLSRLFLPTAISASCTSCLFHTFLFFVCARVWLYSQLKGKFL